MLVESSVGHGHLLVGRRGPIGYGRPSRSASRRKPVGYRRPMASPSRRPPSRLRSSAAARAQTRIINAALELFAEHGVGGTSLQMIADALGVTKAAVYHQFKTKDEIVLAAAEAELAKLEAALDAAEAEPDPRAARDVVLAAGGRPRGRAPAHGERAPARSGDRAAPGATRTVP